ncbi:MAG: ATP-binding protein [Candidatus Micrarchaeota archaeon]|nr:ATP-binding protein [Candidatus Micrarchaeota archaeon]
MQKEVGTVISTPEGPTTTHFDFVISDNRVRKGQFVTVDVPTGKVIGSITEITKANRYFERAESVAEYEKTSPISASFPVSEWEYSIASVNVHGLLCDGQTVRSTYPVSPGDRVFEAEPEMLKKFLQLDESGIYIGNLYHHDLQIKLSLSKLFQKHLAILAMSGSGKSYLTCVLIEELLERPPLSGRIAIVAIDNHGEYSGFKNTQYGKQTTVITGKQFKIPYRKVSPQMIREWIPEMSASQYRELVPIMQQLKREMKQSGSPFGIEDLIQRIELDLNDKKKENIKRPLLGWLTELALLKVIGSSDSHQFEQFVEPGRLLVLDLSDIENQRKKQIIVSYVCRRLFRLRKKEKIAPFLLVVEEAHNFAPEKVEKHHALARAPIITIAREGRKFGACLCLISQRPVHLATSALSQCNTNIILRMTNPFDIKHVGESCEGIDSDMLNSITTLRVGEALIVGEAISSPIFVKIRRRKSEFASKGKSLELLSKSFEEAKKKKEQDVEAFL